MGKPNEKAALDLMNKCACNVMNEFNEIILSYGQSDEFSFVFRPDTAVYSRRSDKIVTNIVSLFASSYVFHWQEFFPSNKLLYPPSFDGRSVLYPSIKNLRDYLSWRQADCHINNLYNTVFWTLVQRAGLNTNAAQERLKGTLAGEKNEILFSEFGINYNQEPAQFKNGTKMRTKTVLLDCDIIGEEFWTDNPHLLEQFKE